MRRLSLFRGAAPRGPVTLHGQMNGLGGDVAALVTVFLLAGLFLGWIVVPERLGAWDRLFVSLALSVPATLLAAAPGIATHSLAAWNVIAGLAALGAVAGWRARAQIRAVLGGQAFDRGPLRRPRVVPTLLGGLALALLWFGVLVPEGIEDTGSGRPNGTIVYYHWGIVSKVVEEGGLPATIPEWGKAREFPYEYGFSVMHGAATANLAGDTGFVLEERYRIAMVLMAFLAAFALWRRWLPPWWAWLAAVLTLNVSRVETRLLVYKPEAFAFVLVLWSAWLLDEALERRSGRWGAMAGMVLATSFLAHPIGSLLVAPLWGGILAGRAIPALWRRWRTRQPSGRATRSGLRPVLLALIVFALLFGALRTVIGSTGQDLAQSPTDGVDKTRVVYNLAYVSADPLARPRVPECSDLFGIYSTVRPFYSANAGWFFFDLGSFSSVLLIAGAALLLGGLFAAQRPPRLARWPAAAKRGAITWACYGVGVCLLALLICAYYSTWVPERVGPMRLMPYWALMFPGLIAAVGWAASRLLSGRRPTDGERADAFPRQAGWLGAGVRLVPAVVLTALAAWTFTAATAARDPGVPPFYIAEPRAGGLSEEALRSYEWMSHHLPRRAVILTNGYVEGALGMLSQRTGLLDGRAPFAQPDPWRDEAIRLLARSRAFFLEPHSTRVPGNATHVLVARPDVNLGGSSFPTAFRALRRARSLEEIKRFDGVVLYRVRDDRAGRLRPSSSASSHFRNDVFILLSSGAARDKLRAVGAAFRRSC